jgi:hypothetical protein
LRSVGLAFFLLAAALSALEAEPRIEHQGLRCIAPGKFALVLSIIDPDEEVQTAKVYFRSVLYPDFYYIEMHREDKGDGASEGDRFIGVLPQVAPETPKVIYYVEVVDQIFDSVRSAEFDPTVGDCKQDPKGAYFAGDNPGIVVGAVSSSASAIPPGFSAAGIVGAITAAGTATGVGGGISTGVVVASAAAAAGVGGVVVATASNAETTSSTSTSTSTAPPSGTTAPSTTTVVGGPPPATTSISPGSTTTAMSTTVPGPATTTSTTPGSTTTTPGSTTSVGATTSISSSSSTTSSSSSTTTSVAAAPLDSSCFTVQLLAACSIRVDATCVSPPVDRYDWVLDRQNKFRRVTISNGPAVVTQTWTAPDCDTDDTLIFRLTVFRGAASSETEKSLFVPVSLKASREPTPGPTTLRVRLELPMRDGSGSARVLVDGTLVRALRSGEPGEITLSLGAGAHELEAVVARADGTPGSLSVAFASAALRPGSIRSVEGNVLASAPDGMTLRLAGASGEGVRLRFELELEP